VTGLVVLDTSSDFTFLGQVIIIILIQIGGLGFMTFTSFFGFFFKGSFSLKSQLFLKDYVNEENIGAINATLIKIVLFTFLVEAVGALLIFSFLDGDLFDTTADHLFISIFHSISAFCNAGFSTLNFGLYESGFRTAYDVHLVIAFVIIIGGIGFPVVTGYYGYLKHVLMGTQRMVIRHQAYRHVPCVANINIRLSVYTTIALLIFGFITFYLFENEHSLKGLSWYGKLVTSFFGSVTPRTAGFNTVDMNAMAMPTVLVYLLLMWVGASPGSTGGGIKTTTFSVALLNILSLARGKRRVEVFNRRIKSETLQKAFAVIVLSLITIGCGIFLVLWFNPEMQLRDVSFEIFSAFATVGLSLGITADLTVESKLVVAFVMFLGRVGTVTFLVALFRKTRAFNYKLPEESVDIT
jgi:trk system potassium uptake protein TrkH